MRMSLWMGLILVTPAAFASGSRSLPAGVEHPAVVEKIFTSPRGEVQFVAVAGGHSAYLRNNSGLLSSLKEITGPSVCEEWLISGKGEAVPRGCDFTFKDDSTGQLYSVRSEEMEEGSLFQVLKSTMRSPLVAL